MISFKHLTTALAAFALLFAVAIVPPRALAADEARPNDVARFLAGLEPSATSPLAPLMRQKTWQVHARVFDQAWKGLDQRQLSKIRTWSQTNITAQRPVMFYMFSGPDFLYANTLFPGASTYVMSGLEPVGRVPELTHSVRRTLPQSLASLRVSMNSILSYSFFRTKDMRVQLSSGALHGTLPVLYVFLARNGMTIHDVELVNVAADGTVQAVVEGDKKQAGGVKIAFSAGNGAQKQTLYYFQTDLSNAGVRNSGFLKFAEQLGVGDALVKSASYLMHADNFSTVRDFLLARTQTIVQDDSGIPLKFFKGDDWDLRPYGKYLGPIPLFAGQYQPQLGKLYTTSAQRIDFGIGYRWRPQESNLLMAVKKNQTAAQEQDASAGTK